MIACGSVHSIVVGNWNNSMSIFVFGWGGRGQLGVDGEEVENVTSPLKIELPLKQRVRDVVCGSDFTILLTTEGNAFGMGSNTYCELSIYSTPSSSSVIYNSDNEKTDIQLDNDNDDNNIGENIEFEVPENEEQNGVLEEINVKIAREIPFKNKIEQIACGFEHTLFLDRNNRVWGCGNNKNGQLGLKFKKIIQKPTMIHFESDLSQVEEIKVKKIACGANYSIVVDKNDRLWSFGRNEYGLLGLSDQIDRYVPHLIPQSYFVSKIEKELKIAQISCGFCHLIILDEEGNVWSCGNNQFGQLGLLDYEHRSIFHMISQSSFENRKICKVACGYQHTMLIDDKGRVWSFGNNELGQLGGNRETKEFCCVPNLVTTSFGDEKEFPMPKMEDVSCGAYHSIMRTSNGLFFSCGRNFNGQLGLNHDNDKFFPTLIPSLHWSSQFVSAINDSNNVDV